MMVLLGVQAPSSAAGDRDALARGRQVHVLIRKDGKNAGIERNHDDLDFALPVTFSDC
jgi:hypothetical protein